MSEPVLALYGGSPVWSETWPAWPFYDDDEVEASVAALRSGKVNYWTGEQGRRFEEEYAQALGVRHAIACANGTVALELGLRAFGIGPGADVIVPAKTFIASASAVVAVGANPVLADVAADSQCLTVETIAAALTPQTKAIIVVHLGGWPADMPAIMAFARAKGLMVMEDCAQAHGAQINDGQVGSFGDCAAFSFCQDKIITTGGEGGLLAFADAEAAWRRAWEYKDHGKSYDAVYNMTHPAGFRWLHDSFGTNMRLTESQAAIGRIQLRKLPAWVAQRKQNALALHGALADVTALSFAVPPVGIESAWYRCYAQLDLSQLRPGWDQSQIVVAVAAEGVPCFVGSCSEIYREQAFRKMSGFAQFSLPVAARLSETSIAFTVHPNLGADEIQATANAVRKVMHEAMAR